MVKIEIEIEIILENSIEIEIEIMLEINIKIETGLVESIIEINMNKIITTGINIEKRCKEIEIEIEIDIDIVRDKETEIINIEIDIEMIENIISINKNMIHNSIEEIGKDSNNKSNIGKKIRYTNNNIKVRKRTIKNTRKGWNMYKKIDSLIIIVMKKILY